MGKQLLLVNHVPIQQTQGRLELDEQTCNSLVHWAKRFDRVVMAGIDWSQQPPSKTTIPWQCVDELTCAEQIEVIPLPFAYRPQDFLRTYGATRQLLQTKMAECQYLCVQLGALIGDWGGVLCLEALRQHRSYAVWNDRVEYAVARRLIHDLPWRRRVFTRAILPIMRHYHQYLIRQCALGLFQGHDCYDAFSPYCDNSHCVYLVHAKQSEQIQAPQLEDKIAEILAEKPLRICYAGQALTMKGPLDWLQTLHRLHQAGIAFEATWLGDGLLLPEMKQLADRLGIADRVQFPGFITDRATIFSAIRSHHIFLFCHKTPESARCLLEALISGCALVGYQSSYPDGLVAMNGGWHARSPKPMADPSGYGHCPG
ncbi:MAG: glycosyltransferase [Leptolyngbyaceae cyanobacterium SL_7_1]|nr:glycosyltransferase [Leptolyngbyaceae cyanobacterium SL_7_1]